MPALRSLVVFSLVSCLLLSCRRGTPPASPAAAPGGRWHTSILEFHIDPSGLRRLPYAMVEAAALAAAQAWALDACSIPHIRIGKPFENTLARRDGQNMIILRSNVWARDGQPANGYYPPDAVALTASYPAHDGARGTISEVDIELNAVQYRWGDAKAVGSDDRSDLQAGLTHEFGHALGLRDNCENALPGRGEAQDRPACATVSAAIMMSAMFPVGGPGQTTQRHPSKAERDALCALYKR